MKLAEYIHLVKLVNQINNSLLEYLKTFTLIKLLNIPTSPKLIYRVQYYSNKNH